MAMRLDGIPFLGNQCYATQDRQNASNWRAIQPRNDRRPIGSLDSRDSLPDAGDPAKEKTSGEGHRGDSQAGEETEEVEREEGQSGRSETRLAVFQPADSDRRSALPAAHELHDSIEHPARSRAQSGLNRAN